MESDDFLHDCSARSSSACVLGFARPAQAQIYAWRDANGNQVLPDRRPCVPITATFAVAGSAFRSTRPASGSYQDRFDAAHRRRRPRDYDVRADLVRAVIQVESGFNPRARSPKGAMGLMQLMPETAAEFGVRNAYNPAENIRGGVAYLRALLDRYGRTRRSRWPPTTPALAPSTTTATPCRRIARPATT